MPRPRSERRSWPAVVLAVVLLLPVLYVASIGPAARMAKHGAYNRTVRVVYWPVFWPSELSDRYDQLLYWYLLQWGAVR